MFAALQRSLFCLLILAGLTASCNLPVPTAVADPHDSTATLFPMQPFMLRQIGLLWGQPYALDQTTVLNGHRDSRVVAIPDVPWARVLRAFLDADIDRASLLDQYRFSSFTDAVTGTEQYFYEALQPKLFTRVLTVARDRESKQVVSVYAETARSNFWSRQEQKLYYAPRKVIQIQEVVTSRLGPDKKSLVEYRFQRNRDDAEL